VVLCSFLVVLGRQFVQFFEFLHARSSMKGVWKGGVRRGIARRLSLIAASGDLMTPAAKSAQSELAWRHIAAMPRV
jgi:hypothetical protein